MTKLVASIAMAGLMAVALGAPIQAQERTMRRVTAGEPAKLQNAMTQSQARRVCQQQLGGSGESRSALRTKMQFCMNEKMQGN